MKSSAYQFERGNQTTQIRYLGGNGNQRPAQHDKDWRQDRAHQHLYIVAAAEKTLELEAKKAIGETTIIMRSEK